MNAVAKVDKIEGEARQEDLPNLTGTGNSVASPAPAPKKKRRGGRFALMLALPLALALAGGYVWVTGGRYEATENANLQQAKVTIAAEEAGRVVRVAVANNERVKTGDVLFEIDPEPYRIAVQQADANLQAARIQVRQIRASYSQSLSKERNAAGELAYRESELERQKELTKKGISSKSSLDEARRAFDSARDEHQGAAEAVSSALAALGGDPDIDIDKHPSVLAAQAAYDKAQLALERTVVRAPADGIVAQASSFRVGQFVGAGTSAFTLVETDSSWIEANFKETQLTHMQPGQTAEIEFDTYPGQTFHARVDAIGAGTGAEFSLLPAQNATGNWVKVTQRIPVRLTLVDDGNQPALRTGMSANVTVDTGHARGLPDFFGTAVASAK